MNNYQTKMANFRNNKQVVTESGTRNNNHDMTRDEYNLIPTNFNIFDNKSSVDVGIINVGGVDSVESSVDPLKLIEDNDYDSNDVIVRP